MLQAGLQVQPSRDLHPPSAEQVDTLDWATKATGKFRTCNAEISTAGKNKNWQQALALLQLMQEAGLVPNVVSYSAAISTCEKSEQWQQAFGL